MAEESIISWNFANWVTVTLMVAILFVLVAMFHKISKQTTATQQGS